MYNYVKEDPGTTSVRALNNTLSVLARMFNKI